MEEHCDDGHDELDKTYILTKTDVLNNCCGARENI